MTRQTDTANDGGTGTDSATEGIEEPESDDRSGSGSEPGGAPERSGDAGSTDRETTDSQEGTSDQTDASDSAEPTVRYQTAPLLQPTIALMGTVALLALIAIGAVWNDPELVGGVEFAELVIYGVTILAGVILIRLAIRLTVLWRTTYAIHEEGFRKEYDLAYHSKARELPVEELRGREYERGRFETVFDCATIRLLTGGTDQSLGFSEFVHVPDSERVDREITTVRRRHKRRETVGSSERSNSVMTDGGGHATTTAPLTGSDSMDWEGSYR